MRVALAFLIAVTAQAAVVSDARACGPSGSMTKSRLLGIDPDGNFVQFEESYGESYDGTTGFVAYDKDGKMIASFDPNGGEPTGDYFSAVLQAQVSDPKIIEADLIANKKLEKPTPRPIRHVMTEARCGSLEIDSKSGWVRVAEVGTLSYSYPETCKPISVQAWDHPKVNVTFVRARFSIGVRSDDDAWVEYDRVNVLPNARIEAAELTLQAERARLAHDVEKAIPLVERAIHIAPEYMPARSALIRAYAKDDRSWDSLVELLNAEIPEGRAMVGAVPSKALMATVRATWKDAEDFGDEWVWSASTSRPFGQSFI